MKLSAKQAKLFFRRAQRRFKVSNDFIIQNMTAMVKFIQYAITPRIVLKRKLIRKRNRVFLRHNYLRKLIFDPTKLKKRRHAKRLHSQWSKRLVQHLRRYSVIEFIEEEEEETTAKVVPTEKDVSEQLKEQLELLKSGRRTIPLLEDPNNLKQAENGQHSIRLSSIDIPCTSEDLPLITAPGETDLEEIVPIPKVPLLMAVHITDEEFKGSDNKQTEKSNGNFLDMLISKVKNTADESGGSETLSAFETSMEPPKPHNNKVCEKEANETEERENSNSSSDFFGFEDNERVLGNFPGMLSTPLVRKRDSNSAFVSETLNAYMRDNSLESSAAINYPQRRPDDGQVLAKSSPPKLDMPALPEGLQGLRTVAERRTFLQRTKNTKYCIINNIGTIFRELQKRTRGHRVYKQAIESLLTSSSVPMTRQGWKAAAWLLTEMGNYYCQTITIDGENFRLYGGRGNYRNKFRQPHSSICKKLIPYICPEDCTDRATFRLLRPVRTPKKRTKLNDSTRKILYKPCPLSQKILQQSRDEESVFCSLDVVRMPQVELEVFPQLQRPLSEIAKKYLQLILPYGEISREWAEFSVSTLLESQNMQFSTKPEKSFTFKLPYANDRNHLIIRRIYKRSEEFEEKFDSSSLSFRKEIDQKNANGEPTDLLSIECADILTDMINSVAIACSENSFIKDDPDNIYQYVGDEDMMEEKSVRKIEQHHQQAGLSNKKQSRLLMELKRLNATVIDAAKPKSEEGGTTCDKECCKLGCVCSSLNEGPTIRQHCGKQRCVIECKCKCPRVMRLDIDGQKITTEDAFMLRRQATAKLARVEKEFTSTVVLTGSETLLINESQYDKKRRCTKVPKRYGDFVEHDDPDTIDSKPSTSKKIEITSNIPLEPVLVNDKIYNRLKHSSVRLKRLKDLKDLAPWCMIHMVYKCFCKGQSTVGNPIVIEKQEDLPEANAIVDESAVVKNRTLYSFDKEEGRQNTQPSISLGNDNYETSETSEASETVSDFNFAIEEKNKIEKRGRISDNHYIEVYMNAKANHCRRVVPIPKNIYKRRNKKRVSHIQLYIAENESDETRLSLNEHVLRSVYYHTDINGVKRKAAPQVKDEENQNKEQKLLNTEMDIKPPVPIKKRRSSSELADRGSSLLLINQYKESFKEEQSHLDYPTALQHQMDMSMKTPPKFVPAPGEQITIPKISQIFSLNTGIVEIGSETCSPATTALAPMPESVPMSAPVPVPMPTPDAEPNSAIDIAQGPTDEMALAHGVSSDAFKNVFKQVIKNMNNLVSKKMQDIDMALRRESKAIPAPNAEILCIIRWNNFLEAYLEGFVYLWEVQTTSLTFIAATIKPIMPLVMNALSVVNIKAILRDKLPLLGRMLIDRKRSASSEGLAVVMQGQKMYWIVKGFLRPDKTRICPKPTPESHPLLTRKINVLCRLLINNQFNEHKKRQDALQTHLSSNSPQISANSINDITEQQPENICASHSDSNTSFEPQTPIALNSPLCPQAPSDQINISLKLKVLPMQRNISDQATAILEQMVSQAYGFVRTNISFRKIRDNELNEIFPPAKMNSNHHWLVLDISNDFSHIFIPELKDLLTLDRIQKVMAYALAKNRIVKMQFSQKSLFNAYVTPKSQRKLYFGPYRHNITIPKLVLLQSVDGQMMLREVYESRHNIIRKTFSTTAFWVIQKNGKIYLDVEQDQIVPVQVNAQEAEAANDIRFLNNNCTIQQICSDDVQQRAQKYQVEENRSAEISIPVQQSSQFNEQCQVLQSKQTEYFPQVQQVGQTLPGSQQNFHQIQQVQQVGQTLQGSQQNFHQIQQGNQIQQIGQTLTGSQQSFHQIQQGNQIDQIGQTLTGSQQSFHQIQQGNQIEQIGQTLTGSQQNFHQIQQHNQIEQIGQTLPGPQQNFNQTQQGNQIEQIGELLPNQNHGAPQNILVKESLFDVRNTSGLEKEKLDLQKTIYMDFDDDDDDDDDCMIVDNEPCAPTPAVVTPVVPPTTALVSEVVPTSVSSAETIEANPGRMNYTISYGGENAPLVVLQNEGDRDSTVMPDLISNSFTILSGTQSPSIVLPEIQNNNLQQNSHQPMSINTIFNLSSEDCTPVSLKTVNDIINPGEIILTFPTNDANTNLSIPAQHLTNFTIAPTPTVTKPAEHLTNFTITPTVTKPNQPEPNSSSISNLKDILLHTEKEKEIIEIGSNSLKLNQVPMKLNKNITIKKIITEVERNPPVPLTYLRKSLPSTAPKPAAISGPRFALPPQNQKLPVSRVPQLGKVIAKIPQRPNSSQPPTQVIRQQTKFTTISQTGQRPTVQNPAGKIQQNIQPRPQGGLIVRTPSTINTIVRAHQQYTIRSACGNTSVIRPALKPVSPAIRLRAPTPVNQIVRLTSSAPKTVSSPLPSTNISTTSDPQQLIRKSLPDSIQTQQKDVLKRVVNTSQQSILLQNAANKTLSTAKPGPSPSNSYKKPQSDPLHISEGSLKAAANNLPPTQLPNGVKTVHETSKQNPIQSPITISGIKRNSMGTPINRMQFRLQPPIAGKQTSLVKGIPIDLPPLKKFAILSSQTQNTTVITPPTSENSCKNSSSTAAASTAPTATASTVKTVTAPTTATASTKASSTVIKANASGSSNANAEYGYFHANLDGLPKFVVKRVGDDFLIKVPNFNGILKLTGLSTVHNYLNQYTSQKCGKTNEEIANLKWTFKAQDRSKLNIMNKSISPITKPGNNLPTMQKLFSLKKNSNEQTASSSASPVPIRNKVKLQSTPAKPLQPNDSIDLSDDE